MITEIKSWFATTIAGIMGIDSKLIVFDLRQDIGGLLPPYGTVLTQSKNYEDQWIRDLETVSSVMYTKFEVIQPFLISMGALDEAQADIWEQALYQVMPRYFWIGDSQVLVTARSGSNTDTEDYISDHYAVKVLVECRYKVNVPLAVLEQATVRLS